MSSSRMSTQSTLGSRYGHLLGGHRLPAPGFDRTTYRRSWAFRQQNYTAVGMHEEFYPITWLQPEMFANGFRDGGLALDGDRRFHIPPLHIKKCNTTPRAASQAGSNVLTADSLGWCLRPPPRWTVRQLYLTHGCYLQTSPVDIGSSVKATSIRLVGLRTCWIIDHVFGERYPLSIVFLQGVAR